MIQPLMLILTPAMQKAADAALCSHSRRTFQAWHKRVAAEDELSMSLTDGLMRARAVAYLTTQVCSWSNRIRVDGATLPQIMDNLPTEQVDALVTAWI